MADEYISKADVMNLPQSIERNLCGEIVERSIDVKDIEALEPADVAPVVRCKDCYHNNDCDIQYTAQAGDNFFCGFGETEKDVSEDVYE